MADFHIKQHDRKPDLEAICIDQDNNVVDLTAATSVKFSMIDPGSGSPKIAAAAGSIVAPPTLGKVRYLWDADDTDTKGDYNGEFEVLWSDGTKTTFPNFRYISIKIVADIA
jgi:BppU N-terminal domain